MKSQISTGFHLSVITHAIAVSRTPLTHLSTNTTGVCVKVKATEHKVRACLADFSTIELPISICSATNYDPPAYGTPLIKGRANLLSGDEKAGRYHAGESVELWTTTDSPTVAQG